MRLINRRGINGAIQLPQFDHRLQQPAKTGSLIAEFAHEPGLDELREDDIADQDPGQEKPV